MCAIRRGWRRGEVEKGWEKQTDRQRLRLLNLNANCPNRFTCMKMWADGATWKALETLWTVSQWRKWVTWGRPWGFIACPTHHSFCFPSTDEMYLGSFLFLPQRCLCLLPCLLCHVRLYFSKINLSSLKMFLSGYFYPSYRKACGPWNGDLVKFK